MKENQYKINKLSGIPYYKQVKEYILKLINQSHNESMMLPPEIELSKQFDISRATVRAAILELAQEGILERVPGKGTFIKEKPNTIRFANWVSIEKPTEDIVARLTTMFNQNIEEGFIKNVGIPYNEIERQLMIMAAGGEAPDISALIYLWIPQLVYNGALEPLDHFYSVDLLRDQHPQTLESVTYQGHLYGINWINAPSILFYHKPLLQEFCGEETLTAEYYDELLDVLSTIHEQSGGTIIPFSIPILDDELFFLASLSNFLHAFGGGIFDERGEIIFHSEATQAAFRWLKRFIRDGHVNITNNSWKNRHLFALGKMAFICEGPWMRGMISSLRVKKNDDLSDIGYATLPKSPRGISHSVLWNHSLSIFKQCENKELAAEFIKYLAFDPDIAEKYYRATGMLPVIKSEVENNPVYDDALGRVLKEQLKTAYPIKVYDPSSFPLTVTICAKASRDILLGDADISSTLNTHAEIVKSIRNHRLT
jgi:ABC-type glycerol-3-phosphate transport system substrate-binding protein